MVVRLDSLSRASQNMKMSMPAQYTSESMPVSTVIWADTTLYVVFGLAEVVSNGRISWGCGKSMIRPFAKRLVS